MNDITLCILSDCRNDLKIAVYSNDKTYILYKYPKYYERFPVHAGQKVKLLYKEGRYWSYTDDKYKSYRFGYGNSLSFTVPSSAKGDGTLFLGDKYMEIGMGLHGAIGWIKDIIQKASCNV